MSIYCYRSMPKFLECNPEWSIQGIVFFFLSHIFKLKIYLIWVCTSDSMCLFACFLLFLSNTIFLKFSSCFPAIWLLIWSIFALLYLFPSFVLGLWQIWMLEFIQKVIRDWYDVIFFNAIDVTEVKGRIWQRKVVAVRW